MNNQKVVQLQKRIQALMQKSNLKKEDRLKLRLLLSKSFKPVLKNLDCIKQCKVKIEVDLHDSQAKIFNECNKKIFKLLTSLTANELDGLYESFKKKSSGFSSPSFEFMLRRMNDYNSQFAFIPSYMINDKSPSEFQLLRRLTKKVRSEERVFKKAIAA